MVNSPSPYGSTDPRLVTRSAMAGQPFTPVQPSFNPPDSATYVPEAPPAPPPDATGYAPPEGGYFPGVQKPMPEEVLVEWQAQSRPFKNRNRRYYVTSGLIVFLISMILLFINEWLLLAVVVSVAFLTYVLYSVPPEIVRHQITTYGIRAENSLYYWDEIGRFWFTEKYHEPVLHLEVARFPYRLTMLLGDIAKDDMKMLLSEVLLEQQPAPTLYDQAAEWLQQKLPLDTD